MRNWIKNLVSPAAKSAGAALSDVSATSAPALQSAIENLEDRRMFSSTLAYGVVANNVNSGTYGKIVQTLRDTGTNTIRMWQTVNNYNDRSSTVTKFINRFHNDGFDITLTVAPKAGLYGSYDQIKNYFAWVASSVGGAVGRVEVGNEVDHPEYYRGSLQSYVNNLLKPAYAGLKTRGETVVSSSVSWNPLDIKTMVDAGMLNYCDMVGYHPYRPNMGELVKAVAQVKMYAQGKPLVATEWSPRSGTVSGWTQNIQDFWPVIRDNFYAAYYYAAYKSGTSAGNGGLLNSWGGANGAFYSTYKGLRFSGAATQVVKAGTTATPVVAQPTPVVTPAPVPVVTPPVNTPAAVTKPAPAPAADTSSTDDGPDVTGFDLLDGDTGTVLYKNVSASTTLKLSALAGHKHLAIQAQVSGKTESVKVGFTGVASHVENTAAYDLFIKDGKASSWTVQSGSYTLSADAYEQDNAKGKSGTGKTITLKFV